MKQKIIDAVSVLVAAAASRGEHVALQKRVAELEALADFNRARHAEYDSIMKNQRDAIWRQVREIGDLRARIDELNREAVR